ncbi:glycosyltransferase family 4 protein [Vibrio splendidus]
MNNIVLSANTSWYLYNFRFSTILALQQQGYNVFCISPRDDHSLRLVNELGCKWFDIKMDNQGSNPIKDMFFFWTLLKLYKKIKPVVSFHFTIKNNIYGTWAAKLAGVKAVNNVSGLGTAFINDNLTSKVVRILYKVSQPFAHKVFCQNPEDYSLLIDQKLVLESKLTLLPGSGVNIKRFHPTLKNVKADNTPFVFLYVGRMLTDKGVLELIEAATLLFSKRQDFVLQLCGFADVKNSTAITETMLNEWSQQPFIEWLGATENIASVYAGSDCVVLPSYREGMPRSLLEAGAMGLPSIATDVPGCKHIISNGYNGLLCTVRDSASLSNALMNVLDLDDAGYNLMCENARNNVVNKYDESIVVEHALNAVC